MDNKELEGLLLYAGVGILILFLLFSMLSLWSNGMVFTWITAKYLLLMACGALTLVLEDSARRRYGIAFAAFLGLLAFGDQLTFSKFQIDDLARSDYRAAQKSADDLENDLRRLDDEGLEFARLQALRKAIKEPPAKAFADGEEKERDERVKEIDEELKELAKELEEEMKVDFEDVEEVAELRWEAEMEKKDVDEQEENLTWAKSLDALILLGGFFILAGALVGGAPEEDDYYGTSTYAYGGTASSLGQSAPTAAAPAAAKPAAPAAAPAAPAAKPAAPAAKPAPPATPPAKPADGGATA